MKTDASFLVLQHREMRLALLPQHGGAIAEFNWRGAPILRPAPADAGDDPFRMACFPMLPFVNRVAHGRFGFAGHEVQLERNWAEDPHPLHGQGWRAPWTVMSASDSAATLRFDGGGDEWPWRYRCEQTLRLLRDGLSIELSIENCSGAPMPAMLGLHPYFPDAPNALLLARAPRMWLTDREALPVEEVPTTSEWSFARPRAIQAVPLDHCFSGWNGEATLRWPDRIVGIHARNCAHLHVYAPVGQDFFCVEPQSAAPGALGRNDGEVAVLTPGQRFAIRVDLTVGAA